MFDNDPIITSQTFNLESFAELPIIVLMGVDIGAISAGFIRLTQGFTHTGLKMSVGIRIFLAGLGVGASQS